MLNFKKFLLLFVLLILPSSLFADGLNIYVSILPQKFFAKKIGGEKVNVEVMVLPGHSPASYSPKPSQMAKLGKTDIFFSIGVPFEKIWIKKIKSNYKNLKIVDSTKGIFTREIEENFFGNDHHEEVEDFDHHHDEMNDPHIWMSPVNAVKISRNIMLSLCKKDKKNTSFYYDNYKKFIKEIADLDTKLLSITAKADKREVFVFHPSFGYFMEDYGLRQIAVESGGKEPTPKYISKLINYAKQNGVGILLVQPQFPSTSVRVMENRLNLKVYKADPLAVNWAENLLKIAEIISDN